MGAQVDEKRVARLVKEVRPMLKRLGALLFAVCVFATLLIGQFAGHPALAFDLALAPCVPVEVATFYGGSGNPVNRVHVKCKSAVEGSISYFAVSTADADNAARILSVLITAYVQGQGKTLQILYDRDDLSGEAIGCLNSNCRLIGGVLLTDKSQK